MVCRHVSLQEAGNRFVKLHRLRSDRGKPLVFAICHAPCLLPVLPVTDADFDIPLASYGIAENRGIHR